MTTPATAASDAALRRGLHALGWGRSQALEYMTANVPLPASEIASASA